MMVRQHGSAPRRLPMLAMTAAVAVVLSGCGGGGGPSSPGGGNLNPGGGGAPSSPGGGNLNPGEGGGPPTPVQTPGFSQGAEGVTVAVSYPSGATAVRSFTFSKSGADWSTAASTGSGGVVISHMTTSWPGASNVDAASNPKRRIAVYTDIAQATEVDGKDVEDADYLVFGYWSKVEGASGVEPFYWGSMPYTGNVPTTTTSDVTYTGVAAGRFSGTDNNYHGHFTAQARLTADFDADGGPTLKGTINSFVRQHISAASPDDTLKGWVVTLNPVTFTGPSSTGGTATGSGGVSGTTTVTGSGTWSAMFFGPSGTGADPTGVAGLFDATLTSTFTTPADPLNPDNKFKLEGAWAANK